MLVSGRYTRLRTGDGGLGSRSSTDSIPNVQIATSVVLNPLEDNEKKKERRDDFSRALQLCVLARLIKPTM